MEPIKLYRFVLSGHSHRAELFLSLLGLPFTRIEVDFMQGAHKAPEFLAKNPLGQLPVIEDGDVRVSDSNAILVYLALRYDESGRWYPRDPLLASQIQRWLSLAAGELQAPGTLRAAKLFGRSVTREPFERTSARLFTLMESTLGTQRFLVGEQPTIADVAMYTYTALAPEGDVSLAPYPALRAWLARIEALPHFVPMKQSVAA